MNISIKKISIILGIMCFLLTCGIFIQIKTVNDSGTEVAKTTTENELRDSVLSMKEKYENAYKTLQNKETELNSLIESTTTNDSNSLALSEKLSSINSILGFSSLQGEGLIITVTDGDVPSNAIDVSSYIVHDETLRMIVNSLYNAGAEAVSINGERIISTTAITCIGNTIKVNDEKVSSPFEIKAIGSKEGLYGGVTISGGYLYNIAAMGVEVEVEKSDSVIVEAYSGIYQFEYASKAE